MADLTIYRATTTIDQAKNTLHALLGKSLKRKILLGTIFTSSIILGTAASGLAFGLGTTSEIGITSGGIAIGIVGSTLVGIAAARDGQMKRGALEGALIGLGCTIASTALLQGSTSALTASALLGIGGTGGALLATRAGIAAKGEERVTAAFINLAGGVLLVEGLLTGTVGASLLGLDTSLLTAMHTVGTLAIYIASLAGHISSLY